MNKRIIAVILILAAFLISAGFMIYAVIVIPASLSKSISLKAYDAYTDAFTEETSISEESLLSLGDEDDGIVQKGTVLTEEEAENMEDDAYSIGLRNDIQTDTPAEETSITEKSTGLSTESDEATVLDSGETGQVTWMFDSSGTLTISGKGYMTDYMYGGAPWYQYADSIYKVILEDGVTKAGAFSFYNCKALSSVTLSDTVSQIGRGAFQKCSSLEKIVLPKNVNTLFQYAFAECSALSSIFIPARTNSIWTLAFWRCNALANVYYGGSESNWENIDFHGSNEDKKILQKVIHYDSEPESE